MGEHNLPYEGFEVAKDLCVKYRILHEDEERLYIHDDFKETLNRVVEASDPRIEGWLDKVGSNPDLDHRKYGVPTKDAVAITAVILHCSRRVDFEFIPPSEEEIVLMAHLVQAIKEVIEKDGRVSRDSPETEEEI